MNSKMHRCLAALLFALLSTEPSVASALSESKAERSRALFDLQRDELSFIADDDPFPETPIAPVDPISKEKMDRVLVGPAFRVRGSGSEYDYYRYVTFYNVTIKKERVYELPVRRENCLKKSELPFATYEHAYSITTTVTASASFEGLGLGVSQGETHTFTMRENLQPIGGVIADHTPYFLKENRKGWTYLQMINTKTQKVAFFMKKQKATPWWVDAFFPLLSVTDYPMDFAMKDADWTFFVERTVIRACDAVSPQEKGEIHPDPILAPSS